MPKKKRPYVPKAKGCYPCARRRIHCDRTGPSCQKCTSRGLSCFGLGLEVQLPSNTVWSSELLQTDYVQPAHDSWEENEDAFQNLAVSDYSAIWLQTAASASDGWQASQLCSSEDSHKILDALLLPDIDSVDDLSLDYTQAFPLLDPYMMNGGDYRLFQPLVDYQEPWKRQLCLHFSKHIAFEMVAIDDQHNSWRHLILPFAYHDELVMSAVLAVSAFHQYLVNCSGLQHRKLSDTLEYFPLDLHALDSTVIKGLKQRCELTVSNDTDRQSILLTILVLQVGAMITGRSDFPSLYRMLESAFEALGGETALGRGEAAEFILSQVDKFRFYGAILLDEKTGLQAISSPSNAGRLLHCLSSRWSERPEHSLTIHFVNDLVRQAIDFYIDQASLEPEDEDPESSHANPQLARSLIRVEHFIETLDALLKSPVGASCEQVLIWSTFVVASGCLSHDHIKFFEDIFLRHYARCGFLNVLVGLDTLRKIWSRRNHSERWTSLIAQTKKLVM